MTYANELESDFSRFHRLDIWSVGVHRVMRLAPHLLAYHGATRLAAMNERSAGTRAQIPAEQPTGYPQAVDNGDTPEYLIEQKQREAMIKQFEARGVHVTGVREISPEDMERQING